MGPKPQKHLPGAGPSVEGKTLPGTSDPLKSTPSKKGRKRKNPIFNELGEEIIPNGPGRPRKKEKLAKDGTVITKPKQPKEPKEPKKTLKEKKELKEAALAAAAAAAGLPVKSVPKKKKYAKLTKEEREARKASKRAAAEEAKLAKKKLKSKPPPKAKEKPPVDVEKQCGVQLPNGGFCARSLTCKTHSMGAKRSVQGRSKPYDVLLAAYQKRNQIKLAELSTQQQIDLENEALLSNVPLNEDEEVEQVMAGVFYARPVPLERKVLMPTRFKNKFFQMREMLIGSLTKLQPLPMLATAGPKAGANAGARTNTTGKQDSTDDNASQTSGSTGQQAQLTPAQVNNNHRLQVMAATSGILGRSIVFDKTTGTQQMRASRAFLNTTMIQQQQQQQARMRQAQMLQMQKLQLQQQQQQQQAQNQGQQSQSPQQSPQLQQQQQHQQQQLHALQQLKLQQQRQQQQMQLQQKASLQGLQGGSSTGMSNGGMRNSTSMSPPLHQQSSPTLPSALSNNASSSMRGLQTDMSAPSSTQQNMNQALSRAFKQN